MSRERRPRTSKISRTSGLAEGCGSSSCSEQDDVPLAVQVLGAWEPVLVRGSRDQKTSAIGAHQRGRVKRAQLLSVGVSDNMIESMMRSGLLIPRMPGVYAVGHAAPTELARETEALLSSSLLAVLCQLSATGCGGSGAHHGLTRRSTS